MTRRPMDERRDQLQAQLQRLERQLREQRRADETRLRIVLGGAAPPTDLPPNVVCTYGMTETGSGIVYDGVPLTGVGIRAVDGELLVRGPMLLRAYRDGTSPEGVDPTVDGWLEVAEGLYEGDKIVVSGTKALWLAEVQAVNGGVGCAHGH